MQVKTKQPAYQIKQSVQRMYALIATQGKENNKAHDNTNEGDEKMENTILIPPLMPEDYTSLPGYVQEADLGLSCGVPTRYANIKPGDVVVDLGSGAGNDCFIARSITGESGRVMGIDFTKEMVEKAKRNAKKMNFNNVEFITGDIEKIPLDDRIADVVISNCTLNLLDNKKAVFENVFRLLKKGGCFCISDIALTGNLPKDLREKIEIHTGRITGAIQKKDYLKLVKYLGFEDCGIKTEKEVDISKNILSLYLSEVEQEVYSQAGIVSITLWGKKPMLAPF